MSYAASYANVSPEDRTECVGTCMVCHPHCGVHRVRRAREQARLDRANVHMAAFGGHAIDSALGRPHSA
jgi:hypothetical protein